MDALAIIQALDYIKNEEVYKKRLTAIQEQQTKLEKIQEICSTVEDAQKQLQEANVIKDKAVQKADQTKKETDEYYTSKMLEIEHKLEELNQHDVELTAREQALKDQQIHVRNEQEQLLKERRHLAQQTSQVQKHLEESNVVRTLYSTKLNELRALVNG